MIYEHDYELMSIILVGSSRYIVNLGCECSRARETMKERMRHTDMIVVTITSQYVFNNVTLLPINVTERASRSGP